MAGGSFSRSRADYGENFDAHTLEQYKLFVETEERLVSRRQEENRFFLSINALVVTVVGVLLRQGISDKQASVGITLLAMAGLALCVAWFSIIGSYKTLNRAKFDVIEEFEAQLPVRMFGAEWDAAESRGYKPFTLIERRVPFIFGALHVVIIVVGLLGIFGVIETG
ncbi:RipA family octameric membrane protein [Candidatus Solirubrobacter pratensis]|uniref:RipA family octameric membrane protein n=1 Tax=Candidatus Solirubrobacter pratensis TaxID=1298857 RepID=UPI0004214CAD|nr:hypothetical protein [Candidatus Solirubrobacter pratensis]